MRTIKEWFNLLPQSIKEKAIDNVIIQQSVEVYETKMCDSLRNSLNTFIWRETSQGADYWCAVHDNCRDNKYLKSVTFSTSFVAMLRKIEDTSDIARLLLSAQYTTHTDFADYITMRGEMATYLPNGREHKITESGKWSRDGRQEMKIGKLARKILRQSYIDSITDADFEKFTNCVKSYISLIGDEDGIGKKLELRLINGSSITHAYCEDNYSTILGRDSNLWGSCMRHEECESWLAIYEDNTEVCQLLIAEDTDGMILGRAIVWKLVDDRYAMDTIYAPDSIRDTFINYAIKEGWIYKSSQSCHHNCFDRKDGKFDETLSRSTFVVKLKHYDYEVFPYMDTLYNLDAHGLLSNHPFDGRYKILRSTDGGYEEGGMIECEWTGRWISEEDSCYIGYERPNGQYFEGRVWSEELIEDAHGDMVLSCDVVEEYSTGQWYLRNDEDICVVPSRDEYRLKDDCTWSPDLNEWILSDDAIETGDGKIFLIDDCFECCVDGSYYHDDDHMTEEIDGILYRFYEGNKEQFFEQFKIEKHETGVN